MSEKNLKNEGTLDPELVKNINSQLEQEELKTIATTDIDPDELIRTVPLVSIAESLYHIERTMKAMLYIQNCNADSALAYRRENFYAILGGTDPELLEQAEIERLQKLDKEFLEKQNSTETENGRK